MENFIKLQINKNYTLYQNVIISYLQSYQANGKYYYAGIKELSSILNIPISSLNNSLDDLIKKQVIFKSQDKKHINATFNNRKAIVLVDNNNPIPTNNTPKETSNNTSTKSNINIPEKEKEVVREEIIEKDTNYQAEEELDKILGNPKTKNMKKNLGESEDEFRKRINEKDRQKMESMDKLKAIKPTEELKKIIETKSEKDYSYLTPEGNIKK